MGFGIERWRELDEKLTREGRIEECKVNDGK